MARNQAKDGASTSSAGRSKQRRRLVELAHTQTGRLREVAASKAAAFVETRKGEVAGQIDTVAGVVRNFAERADGDLSGLAGIAASRGGDALDELAQSVRDHSVDEIVDGARGAISRHPAIAVGLASLIGFAAGRIVKGGLSQSAAIARGQSTTAKPEYVA